MKANNKKLILLAILLNAISITATQADEGVDAEFLEFLADMEEATGSGFDAWLNDADIDDNEERESIELQK